MLSILQRVQNLLPGEKQIYDDAMRVVYEKSWHLANYVKSLSPEKRPESAIGNNVLRSQYVQGELPAMDNAAWETLKAGVLPFGWANRH